MHRRGIFNGLALSLAEIGFELRPQLLRKAQVGAGAQRSAAHQLDAVAVPSVNVVVADRRPITYRRSRQARRRQAGSEGEAVGSQDVVAVADEIVGRDLPVRVDDPALSWPNH